MSTSPPPTLSFDRAAPIFLLTLVDVLGLSLILPLLHLYAARFSASPLEIGLVLATFPLCQLVGVPLMGALSDRYGRKPLLLISQITTCVGFIILARADSLALILLSRAVDGLFGANLATAQAAISDITDERTRAQGLGLTGAAFGLGFIFGPLIALLTLEFTDDLAMPAVIAALYSFLSILVTLFMFRETRWIKAANSRSTPADTTPRRWTTQILVIFALLFAQQVIFFGFESLLGLFTLTRLGLLGQGNALIFIVVGVVLVMVQARFMGKWVRRYGEQRLAVTALGLLAAGLILVGLTPRQPHPLYVRGIVERELTQQRTSSAEAVLGEIPVELPENRDRGFSGMAWLVISIVPLTVGAALIRPNLNSLLTKSVNPSSFGRILGISAALVSGANAFAPILGAYIFQQAGSSAPFLLGGAIMAFLTLLAAIVLKVREVSPASAQIAVK